VAAIRPAALGPPPRERGESERGREGGAATRSQFARVSPPLESPSVSAWMRVIGARRRVALIGRDLVSIRGRELSLSRLAGGDVETGGETRASGQLLRTDAHVNLQKNDTYYVCAPSISLIHAYEIFSPL